jgi:sporulation protein YlmC with PRC-barrel domain
MSTDNNLRSEFLNTQVITRNTGKRLGVVKEIYVDIDRREVISLGLRDNRFSVSGLPRYMYISNIRQTGDVILVEDEDVIEDINVELYSQLINSEVITEAGEPLGRVRDFVFSPEDGKVFSILIASIGLPQIPEQMISTYELSMEEVISSGPNRLVVFEGAEDRLTQVSVGWLERLGIGRPPWEKQEEESYYPPTVKPENQLGTGIPLKTPTAPPVEIKAPAVQNNWNEDDWQQEAIAPPPPRRQQYQEYEQEEESNWNDEEQEEYRYQSRPPIKEYQQAYPEPKGDVWDDDTDEPYNPPRVNIPEKQREKAPEYEEGL